MTDYCWYCNQEIDTASVFDKYEIIDIGVTFGHSVITNKVYVHQESCYKQVENFFFRLQKKIAGYYK